MTGNSRKILVLGGARSGKSRYAETLGRDWPGPRIYVATAQPGDDEMAARIQAHQARRNGDWNTVTALLNLPDALRDITAPDTFVLVDCLTIWLSNMLLAEEDCEGAVELLISVLEQTEGTVVFVSNEVGHGIVPENALARRFRDLAGDANQRMAQTVDEVVLVTAGLPQVLKRAT